VSAGGAPALLPATGASPEGDGPLPYFLVWAGFLAVAAGSAGIAFARRR